jgi:hypothetical protein
MSIHRNLTLACLCPSARCKRRNRSREASARRSDLFVLHLGAFELAPPSSAPATALDEVPDVGGAVDVWPGLLYVKVALEV